jgi:hypothetical protein
VYAAPASRCRAAAQTTRPAPPPYGSLESLEPESPPGVVRTAASRTSKPAYFAYPRPPTEKLLPAEERKFALGMGPIGAERLKPLETLHSPVGTHRARRLHHFYVGKAVFCMRSALRYPSNQRIPG